MKNSPLKQQQQQNQGDVQNQLAKTKGMMEAGMDILGNAQKIKNWEELQLDIRSIEPQSMQLRKAEDQVLRNNQKAKFEVGQVIGLSKAYSDVGLILVKQYKEEFHEALVNDDREVQANIKTKLGGLSTIVDVIKDAMADFYEDHFLPESLLSKGNSQQQISFGTQMYCDNPNLNVVFAVEKDVIDGHTDYYGDIVKEDGIYAIVYDFSGQPVMIPVGEGNKDIFIIDNLKATEYLGFLTETNEKATQANADKAAIKIDLGRINYKIDTLFGYNDGTATKDQDELVISFAHDDSLLEDGSTFRRHLYEHPNIKNLNHGGFDFENISLNLPLGPGDKNYWYDQIDDIDRLKLVDAIINIDSPFFDLKLLRTLVKEYYTHRIENAWWKGMGFEEGKLGIMRLKQKELIKQRFKMEKAKAAQNGQKDFLFDGKVYPTGADLKKQKAEEERAMKNVETQNQ